MLTAKQIKKVARLGEQTGGFDGFYEPGFEIHEIKKRILKKDDAHRIRISLAYKVLPSGDVVIQKK